MNPALALGFAAAVLLLPLAIAAARQRALLRMALRNINRRQGEAVLVVAGAMLGTAVITSSLVVGDIIEASFADIARTRYGPVDLVLAVQDADEAEAAADAVRAAETGSIDGLLIANVAPATLEAPQAGVAAPQVSVLELDVTAAAAFGTDSSITGLVGVDAPRRGEIILNRTTAAELDLAAGGTVRVHAYDSHVDLVVADVVPEVGLAGYGGAIVSPGTMTAFAASAPTAAGPQAQLLVSVEGGVFDTQVAAETASRSVRQATGLPAAAISVPKADVLRDAERQGSELATVFTMIGSFSVIAGILLLINLFVMLSEERKTELGMLRAVGFTRRRLVRAFAVEGAAYAILAAAAGAAVGIGIGWLVAVAAGKIFTAGETTNFPLTIHATTVATGAAAGLVISLATIWVTSVRIARLNIIRAIRDLETPRGGQPTRPMRLLSAIGVLAGSAMTLAGLTGEAPIPLLLGVPIAAFSAVPVLRRVLPQRAAGTSASVSALAWGLAVNSMFPTVMDTGDMAPFVAQGVVLTAGAVGLASNLDRVWMFIIERAGRGRRGLASRLGVAYPLARRFRTSMLLAMFSLVIFTATVMTAFSGSFEANSTSTVENMAAGFDLAIDFNAANPVEVSALEARADVTEVAALHRSGATFEAATLEGSRQWPLTGFDAALLAHGGPQLLRRAGQFKTDVEAFEAVADDQALAIVPENFLVTGADSPTLDLGDNFTAIGANGNRTQLTIVGIGDTDWLEAGAMVSTDVTARLLGAADVVTRAYVQVTDGMDPEAVADELNAAFLTHGANARTFTAVAAGGAQALTSFLALLRGFLAFGLLVGIAGLAVVMVRAVRERRREIGMLRAMGFGSRLVRSAMLYEAGLIAAQGTTIGALLGLATARQMLTSSSSVAGMQFTVPWAALLAIVALPLLASLAATAWPAARAAAIRPAAALRTAD